MKNDTYDVNKKNITVTSIGSLLLLKKLIELIHLLLKVLKSICQKC